MITGVFTVAVIASVESLLSAVAVDKLRSELGRRAHRPIWTGN